MNTTTRRTATSAVLAAGLALGTAAAAHAAQQYVPLMCDNGDSITVRTPTNSAQQSWSVGQIVDGGAGHLIPLSFSFSFVPAQGDPFSWTTTKGGGHAGPDDQPVTCTSTTYDGGDTFTIIVTAVPRP
jgi:hypothetical protein